MQHRWLPTMFMAAAVAASATIAMAQVAPPSSPGGSAAGSPGVSPATPPPAAPPATTGSNTGVSNQPGVPNTSTPGSIGTGASPSGLPGDSTSTPGYPGAAGGQRR